LARVRKIARLSDFTYISEHQKKSSVRYDHIYAEVVNDEANLKQEGERIKHKEKPTKNFSNFMMSKMNK
jgi:hypothetical protein